jgi:hypothetical protein
MFAFTLSGCIFYDGSNLCPPRSHYVDGANYRTEKVKVYRTRDEYDKMIDIRFYDDTPNIPYINVIDYFREFFKAASASPNPIRHLTIVTYDNESERNIKDNIRNQGISVTDLYSNLWTFDVIHTSKLYANDEKESKKWNDMFARLLAKDRHGI